jgi:RimJ/RimL family protein N-acetyltransferase
VIFFFAFLWYHGVGGIIMEIRRTTAADLPALEQLYAQARAFMAANGNPHQWGANKPPRSTLESDIAQGHSYVCLADGVIVAAFFFGPGPDPTYDWIDGQWLDDGPYWVVHRIATGGSRTGAGAFCLRWCLDRCRSLRIDTHRDNLPMQQLLQKLGFSPCGTIRIADGTERLAFQKLG